MKSSRRTSNKQFIQCHNAAGRRRAAVIANDEHGNVTIGMLAGEVMVLSRMQVGQLRRSLKVAVETGAEVAYRAEKTA
jgi:hypothetical protein